MLNVNDENNGISQNAGVDEADESRSECCNERNDIADEHSERNEINDETANGKTNDETANNETNGETANNEDSQTLFLIVGLGNPGEDYAETRHNAGFKVIDALADDIGVHYWKSECGALTGKGTWHGIDAVLAKPQSYMNASGEPVKRLMAAYGVDADHLVVIHDDLDILPGNVRVKFGGGHAGHNGLRSLFDTTGTRDWFRVRIGIGYPPGCMGTTDYVLMAPRKDAAEDFAFAIDRGTQATLYLLEHGLEKTQQQFNQITQNA